MLITPVVGGSRSEACLGTNKRSLAVIRLFVYNLRTAVDAAAKGCKILDALSEITQPTTPEPSSTRRARTTRVPATGQLEVRGGHVSGEINERTTIKSPAGFVKQLRLLARNCLFKW